MGASGPLPKKRVFALPVFSPQSVLVEICCQAPTWKACCVITQTDVVHALPGADVTLVCSFPKAHTTYIIQTQWSKKDNNHLTIIAVHHPDHGTHYFAFPEASYNFSWALHLKNVTVSLSGLYECRQSRRLGCFCKPRGSWKTA
uniref:Ig-like domain-containing protein n=1 Tax=Athene cunicularia TaxID=194338 RepID=A0A663NDX4_ATHCN